MDEIQANNGTFISFPLNHGSDSQISKFSEDNVTQALNMSISQTGRGTYRQVLNFQSNIKVEKSDEVNDCISPTGMDFQTSSAMIKTEIPVGTQAVHLPTPTEILGPSPVDSHKVLSGQHNIVSVGQAINLHAISNVGTLTTAGNLIPSSTSASNGVLQPVPMFHSTSFDDGVLSQHQAQTFVLTSSGAVISSNSIQSQDELVGVYIPTSSANSLGYTIGSSEPQYVTNTPVIPNANQTSTRLIIHPSQPNATTLPHPVLSTSTGNYLIQVGNTALPTANTVNSNLSFNNKGHIVIKSGGSKVKNEIVEAPATNDGVFRVVIRDGTTRISRPIQEPMQVISGVDESVRKHVQINLGDRDRTSHQLRVPTYGAAQTQTQDLAPESTSSNRIQKLYECSNCNSKFMRPLYLRMHKRSCKKPEVKLEKIPWYMCSFCKFICKTKPQIHNHLGNCSQNPYPVKESSGKDGKLLEIDTALEQAIQYKCQDCERTFSKERQYTSHIRRCTEVSFHDLSGARLEAGSEELPEEGPDNSEDPFADPPLPHISSRRGRGVGGRRGRPPRKTGPATKATTKSNILFEGPKVVGNTNALLVIDNENLVRSTTGLAHTVQLTLETAMMEEKPQPNVLVTDSKGVRGRVKAPQAWSLVCSLCRKMFLTKAALATHIIENHGNDLITNRNILQGNTTDSIELYKCPLCTLHFQSENDFLEHLVLKHTTKLQDCYSYLQMQKGSFICSLCSIVLLTKTLLMEHLSLEHLEELQLCAEKNSNASLESNSSKGLDSFPIDTEDSWDGQLDATHHSSGRTVKSKIPHNDDNPMECCFCGEILKSNELLLKHYIDSHDMETDTDGCILDMGIDVDIKVKDTRTLLQMADSKMTEGTLSKTVLIKKGPKQSWQCQSCQQVFPRQISFLHHRRDGCSSATNEAAKSPTTRESHFFCHERECSHLSFYQVKTLFKHMEETHNIIVRKERRTFKTLGLFQQWLINESSAKNVKFVTETTKIERGNVKLLQMVCQRFHSARANQAREKEADLSKPTKKRLYVRIQRSCDCHARIHLRVELNEETGEYVGETQMIYYPEHSHNNEEVAGCLDEKIPDLASGKRGIKRKNNGMVNDDESPMLSSSELQTGMLQIIKGTPSSTLSANPVTASYSNSSLICLPTQNGGATFEYASTSRNSQAHCALTSSNVFMLHDDEKKSNPLGGTYIVQTSMAGSQPSVILPHASSIQSGNSVILPNNTLLVQSGGTLMVRNGDRASVTSNSPSHSDPKSVLIDPDDANGFMVQEGIVVDVDQDPAHQEDQAPYSDEYVLPADESEWIKLFNMLKERLRNGILVGLDKKEGEELLNCQSVAHMLEVPQQVSIFQKLCTLTDMPLDPL